MRPAPAWCCGAAIFLAGFLAGSLSGAGPAHAQGAPTGPDEPPPPSKAELGRAGWTLIHVTAANFPDRPTPRQRNRAEAWFRALGDLYPCADCAAHLRQYMAGRPPDASTREALSLWACDAHNEVNRRNGRPEYYCDIGVLDARWKDCGCGKANATDARGAPPARGVEARQRGEQRVVERLTRDWRRR